MDYIAAEEAGTAEASDLVSDIHLVGGLLRGSTYQQEKNTRQCGHCAEPGHGSNSPAERKKSCKAWCKTCDTFKQLHHYTKAKASPIEATDDNMVNTNSWNVEAMTALNFFPWRLPLVTTNIKHLSHHPMFPPS